MKLRIIIPVIFSALFLTTSASAQTPTATPGPAQLQPIQFPTVNAPTLIPSVTPPAIVATDVLPLSHIYNQLATTEANLRTLPEDIRQPNGFAALPNERNYVVFSYAKWLFSANIASEVFGPFDTIIIHMSVLIGIVLFLAAIYLVIFLVRFALRFIVWLISQVLKLIP